MNILGINAWHGDSSAALVCDGALVAAVEEERFNRIKHWAGWPEESIQACLRLGGIAPEALDHIAVSFNPRAQLLRKFAHALRHRPSATVIGARLRRQLQSLSLRERTVGTLGCAPSGVRFWRVGHHDAHMACGYLPSPFEDAAILSIDGMGDFVSTVLARGQAGRVRKLGSVFYPHSLGFLYNALTLFLGFPAYGDEYKVMGLAPYGRPRFLPLMREIIRPARRGFELDLRYFRHHREGIKMQWEGGVPVVMPFHSRLLEEALGPPRHPSAPVTSREEDIAASLQAVTEEILFHLAEELRSACEARDLVLVGGVAMNSVAAGKIRDRGSFERVYVPPGAADNGTAIGAAFHVWNRLGGGRRFALRHAYWGPRFSTEECLAAVAGQPVRAECLAEADLIARVVDALCGGEVVGWFQGRMEFGARALGNRSLLADPRRADMRDIINARIKFRERFRPFAPSVLVERVAEWFEAPQSSPFMDKVLRIREDKRALIPAVTHVDGTGRLQTVDRETAPLYWRLIRAFEERTSVPMVLNTSLNENEPIVHTPREALDCFLRTEMDAIALGELWVRRESAKNP